MNKRKKMHKKAQENKKRLAICRAPSPGANAVPISRTKSAKKRRSTSCDVLKRFYITGISPTANIFARGSRERALFALLAKCEPERLRHGANAVPISRTKSAKKRRSTSCDVLLLFLVTHPGIEPEFPAWEASVLTAWPMGLASCLNIITYSFSNCKSFFYFLSFYEKQTYFTPFFRLIWRFLVSLCLQIRKKFRFPERSYADFLRLHFIIVSSLFFRKPLDFIKIKCYNINVLLHSVEHIWFLQQNE